jgi:hypothetical protein
VTGSERLGALKGPFSFHLCFAQFFHFQRPQSRLNTSTPHILGGIRMNLVKLLGDGFRWAIYLASFVAFLYALSAAWTFLTSPTILQFKPQGLYINDIPVSWIVLSLVVMQFMNLYRTGVDGYRKWKGFYHTHRPLSQE